MCACVFVVFRATTFERNNLLPNKFGVVVHLDLHLSSTQAKIIGHSSRLQNKTVSSLVESKIGEKIQPATGRKGRRKVVCATSSEDFSSVSLSSIAMKGTSQTTVQLSD